MPTTFQPLQDRVLVKRVESETRTKGGLFIPDQAKEKPVEGTVIAVGTGRLYPDGTIGKLDVEVGDTILFGKFNGTEISLDGEEHLILREQDILGRVAK